jgi:hypothetical protein
MFAWAMEADANNVRDAMVAAFASAGFGAGAWVADIAERGAHLVAD